MSLKTGDWNMNENGIEGTLAITNVDANGAVSGKLGGFNISGIWDETSRTLTFAFPVGVSGTPRFFKGFLFSTPRTPAPGIDIVWTLAGYVQAPEVGMAAALGGNARRSAFGWFAQITEVA
jgi:hypothetical protein